MRTLPREAGYTALALFALLLWDASGWDLPLAMVFGDAHGFQLRDNAFVVAVLYDGPRLLGWLFIVLLCVALVRPFGPMTRMPLSRRVQLVATALIAWGSVALIKATSHTSCPWDLQDFGGIARYVSHWQGWQTFDGGSGRCFPSGHATIGFAFVGGYFALRDQQPWMARVWLRTALAIGVALGLVQQARGAHFISHTLWTAWICWAVAWSTDPLFALASIARDLDSPL